MAHLDYCIARKQAAGVVAPGLHHGRGDSVHGGCACIFWSAEQSSDDSAVSVCEGGGRGGGRGQQVRRVQVRRVSVEARLVSGGLPEIWGRP